MYIYVHDTTPKMGSSARRYPFINRSFITPVKHLLGIYVSYIYIYVCTMYISVQVQSENGLKYVRAYTHIFKVVKLIYWCCGPRNCSSCRLVVLSNHIYIYIYIHIYDIYTYYTYYVVYRNIDAYYKCNRKI